MVTSVTNAYLEGMGRSVSSVVHPGVKILLAARSLASVLKVVWSGIQWLLDTAKLVLGTVWHVPLWTYVLCVKSDIGVLRAHIAV